jgi:hypothetical protein
MLDINALFTALLAHSWLLAIALVFAALASLARQRIAWIDSKVPPSVVPAVAIVLTFVTTASADIIAGQGWTLALADAAKAAFAGLFLALQPNLGIRKKSPGSRDPLGRLPSAPTMCMAIALTCVGYSTVMTLGGCTPAEQAAVLSAEQDACQAAVLGESFIPSTVSAATVAQVASDIQLVCGIAQTATQYITQVVNAYVAQHSPDGGSLPGSTYIPSPRALARRGLVVAPQGSR